MQFPILFTPGPVSIPPFVNEALTQPARYHRNKDFEEVMANLEMGLRYFFQTESQVFGMVGSGTAGMESVLYSLCKKDETVIVAHNGKFSKRWADYARLLDIRVVEVSEAWGVAITKEKILIALEEHPSAKAVVLTHCETSTGVCLDLEEISFAIKEASPACLVLVDGISSIGATAFYFDAWKIDVAVVASQKALLNPTGTCYFAFSEVARQLLQPTHVSDYHNLYNYSTAMGQYSFPYSPPINLFFGILAALRYYQEIGLPQKWNEVHSFAQDFRLFLSHHDWIVFGGSHSDGMTCFYADEKRIASAKSRLAEMGLTISGGQDGFVGKLLRVAHFGFYTDTAIQNLKKGLAQ